MKVPLLIAALMVIVGTVASEIVLLRLAAIQETYPFIEMNPDDMAEVGVGEGDLVEVYNDAGATPAMVYPTPTARRGETLMLFAFPTGVQGNVRPAPTSWSSPTTNRPGATSERSPIGLR